MGHDGFTLIELLVTLAVLLILIVAFGAYYVSNRPHARLANAANDLLSDIRLIRGDAVKRGVTATVATIDFTSTTRYRVVDAAGVANPIRNFVPTAGEVGSGGEYLGVSFVAQPLDLFACSSGTVNALAAAPANSGACTSTDPAPIQIRHPNVPDGIWPLGSTHVETRTICITFAGAVSCWRGTTCGTAGELRC